MWFSFAWKVTGLFGWRLMRRLKIFTILGCSKLLEPRLLSCEASGDKYGWNSKYNLQLLNLHLCCVFWTFTIVRNYVLILENTLRCSWVFILLCKSNCTVKSQAMAWGSFCLRYQQEWLICFLFTAPSVSYKLECQHHLSAADVTTHHSSSVV